MLRSVICGLMRTTPRIFPQAVNARVHQRQYSQEITESPEDFDKRFLEFFNKKDMDGWWLRKGLTELNHNDVFPEPEIIIAALKACRRVNELSVAIRFLEVLEFKAKSNKDIWPWTIAQIQPTITELGLRTPNELGFDKPELALKIPEDY